MIPFSDLRLKDCILWTIAIFTSMLTFNYLGLGHLDHLGNTKEPKKVAISYLTNLELAKSYKFLCRQPANNGTATSNLGSVLL
jgi:hypothetical protein